MIKVFIACIFNSIYAIDKNKDKWIQIETKQVDNSFHIYITDSGNGISNAIQDKLMQPFFTTKETGYGVGLGLSTSKGIIESHHGSFYLDKSHPNTRFVISLPMKHKEIKKAA